MAATKKKTRKRKTATVAGTRTIGGKKFSHKMCGNKGAMKARAAAARKKGKRARVLKVGKRYCLYTRG
jgi:hypothetical protein